MNAMAETETTIVPLTLTKEEASAALNVPDDTLLNLTRTGQLRSIMVGKHKRWVMDDLCEFVQRQRDERTCARKAG